MKNNSTIAPVKMPLTAKEIAEFKRIVRQPDNTYKVVDYPKIANPVLKVSGGNTKLGPVPNISKPPVLSCTNCEGCNSSKGCFGIKFYNMRGNVRQAWNNNYDLITADIAKFFSELSKWFDVNGPKMLKKGLKLVFRYDAVGDIMSQDEADYLIRLATAHSDWLIFGYTKNQTLDWSKQPANLQFYASQWPGMAEWGGDLPKAWFQPRDNSENRMSANSKTCTETVKRTKGKTNCSRCLKCPKGNEITLHQH